MNDIFIEVGIDGEFLGYDEPIVDYINSTLLFKGIIKDIDVTR